MNDDVTTEISQTILEDEREFAAKCRECDDMRSQRDDEKRLKEETQGKLIMEKASRLALEKTNQFLMSSLDALRAESAQKDLRCTALVEATARMQTTLGDTIVGAKSKEPRSWAMKIKGSSAIREVILEPSK